MGCVFCGRTSFMKLHSPSSALFVSNQFIWHVKTTSFDIIINLDMQMKDSIYDMLHESFSTTLFLLVEIPDCIIQGLYGIMIVKNVTSNDIYNSNKNVIFVTYYIKKWASIWLLRMNHLVLRKILNLHSKVA